MLQLLPCRAWCRHTHAYLLVPNDKEFTISTDVWMIESLQSHSLHGQECVHKGLCVGGRGRGEERRVRGLFTTICNTSTLLVWIAPSHTKVIHNYHLHHLLGPHLFERLVCIIFIVTLNLWKQQTHTINNAVDSNGRLSICCLIIGGVLVSGEGLHSCWAWL